MTAPKVLDLDKELGIEADLPITTRKVTLLGLEVRVVCDLNRFGLMSVIGDDAPVGAVMSFLQSMIDPADWPAFVRVAGNHPALRGELGDAKLTKIVMRLMEVASDPFPTKQPSDLPRTASTRSSPQKSGASTASGRAKASRR